MKTNQISVVDKYVIEIPDQIDECLIYYIYKGVSFYFSFKSAETGPIIEIVCWQVSHDSSEWYWLCSKRAM